MSASSILFLVAAGHFVEGLVELRVLRDDLCGRLRCRVGAQPNLNICCSGGTGKRCKAHSDSQGVYCAAVARRRAPRVHVARGTAESGRLSRAFGFCVEPSESDTRASGTSGVAVD